MGLVRKVALAVIALAVVAVAVYWFGLRGSSTPDAEAQQVRVVAQIGNGKRVVLVGDDGKLLGSASGAKADQPVLPLKKLPPGRRVRGHVLEEVRILAAAPKVLRPYIAATAWGKTGAEVELTSGILVRFGDQSEATRKWKAAAAVLADPSVTLLSYVDVHAPTRPAVGGEGHELPPAN
ncbi:MAG TPA: cell division protein FtsQ/DivIB [Solirubrobacterales bacterium]|nr:cell division protein FtsQ/DivIB [Solirubrobacterales bacterium]